MFHLPLAKRVAPSPAQKSASNMDIWLLPAEMPPPPQTRLAEEQVSYFVCEANMTNRLRGKSKTGMLHSDR